MRPDAKDGTVMAPSKFRLCLGRTGLRSETSYVEEQLRLKGIARVQKAAAKEEMEKRCLAFAMALHARLGKESAVAVLDETTMMAIATEAEVMMDMSSDITVSE